MSRSLVFFFSAALVLTASAEEGSTTDNVDSMDIEPPLLIPNRGDGPLPDVTGSASPAGVDLAQLEKNLGRARRSAAGAERLCKIGVLSKVEAEQRALRVVRLEFDLENARLARAKVELADQESRVTSGENSKAELETARSAVTRATETVQAAAVKRERAEIEAAETNLRRQRKLLALGSARKSDVVRAEQKLAELKAPKN
jgi:outer membrane protein TolC